MTTIVQVATADELDDVRRLLRAFASWRRERHGRDVAPVAQEPNTWELEEELTGLPEQYTRPHGRLLIAYEADQPAGCAALCDRGQGVCEVQQIFVAGRFRGQHVGLALIERLLLEARAAGYQRMCLGISLDEDQAMRLCERTGFQRIGGKDTEAADRQHGPDVLFERDLQVA